MILFIDSSKTSLKAVILHKTNEMPPVPIAYSTDMKENYDTLKQILLDIKYEEHQWRISCDLKVVAILMGLQLGYTKHMCFMCLWDTRFKGNQYQTHYWADRATAPNVRGNVIHPSLVEKEKILMPPLHIKLGIVKNFIKAIVGRSEVFECLRTIFPRLSIAKIKEGHSSLLQFCISDFSSSVNLFSSGILNGPDIGKLMKSNAFDEILLDGESVGWDCVKAVINNFLGKHRSEHYRILVADMLNSFESLDVHMSLKIHFLNHHLDYFENQLASESVEHGERFHQIVMPMEVRYNFELVKKKVANGKYSIIILISLTTKLVHVCRISCLAIFDG